MIAGNKRIFAPDEIGIIIIGASEIIDVFYSQHKTGSRRYLPLHFGSVFPFFITETVGSVSANHQVFPQTFVGTEGQPDTQSLHIGQSQDGGNLSDINFPGFEIPCECCIGNKAGGFVKRGLLQSCQPIVYSLFGIFISGKRIRLKHEFIIAGGINRFSVHEQFGFCTQVIFEQIVGHIPRRLLIVGYPVVSCKSELLFNAQVVNKVEICLSGKRCCHVSHCQCGRIY